VYSDADVYLLDDPLSAVDAEVGRWIVTRCILGLLRDKPRILITHQLQYLASMTEILLLVDGTLNFRGNYKQLINSGIPFTEILTKLHNNQHNASASSSAAIAGLTSSAHLAGLTSSTPHLIVSRSTPSVIDNNPKMPIHTTDYFEKQDDVIGDGHDGKVISGDAAAVFLGVVTTKEQPEEEEELVVGGLEWGLYWSYLSAGSSLLAMISVFAIAVVTQICFTSSDLWLQFWYGSFCCHGYRY
jgi:ABC-type sulfate/molybdate transport systems ATPase subunit